MNKFDTYQNTKHELNLYRNRLNILLKYELQLAREKEMLDNIINLQIELLNQMEKDLKNLNGIENRLYYEIVVKGMRVSKAIEKISLEGDKDVSTLWKNYYPKVKRRIGQLNYKILSSKILEDKTINSEEEKHETNRVS